MSKELARDLISAGVHFGHAASRWNPKMNPYIFGKRSKIHIIDVKETLRGLLIGKKLLADVVGTGKDVLFVGTKRQAQKAVEKAADACDMHYASQRWLGGMLTNFSTVRSRLKRLEELEEMESSGKLAAESKKQGSRLKREMNKISTNLGGVRKMNRLPGAVVVVDAKKEYLALREARKLGIATIAIIDTDSDPDGTDVAIPANDDSIKAVEILLSQLASAVTVGKTMVKASGEGGINPQGVRGRSRRRAMGAAGSDAPAPVKPAAPVAAAPAPAEAPAAEAAPEAPAADAAPAPAPETEETN